ncbi:glycerol-3-phosphate 1-O-acyltransferase PlsY [Mycoplasma struthionis]|uniref:Glycerol-3-phosphate acyltransferase n=2 Tax=Mycoplasma struthionis TaxID=538220 RepID=A0A3G8LG69_9MOLU|nr:glycerol-3-phosphate 1-O-acyltransferase PlsY [Mycoplasma struthionis]AZG68501.1 glycerol-3-phosphate 1-O-acyltransferase [Mycoplasma struthionis]
MINQKFEFQYLWINAIILFIAYLIGSINIAIIISKSQGQDIRELGSKNAGATNALRVKGKKFGILVFGFDILKSYLSILIVFLIKFFLKDKYIFPLIAGLGAMIGHIFPLYFKFKGGKGVACYFGMIFAFDIMMFLIFLMLFIMIILIFKMVSLAATVSSFIVSPLTMLPGIYLSSIFSFMQQNTIYPVHSIILIIATAFIIIKHIPNFIRIVNKNENTLKI